MIERRQTSGNMLDTEVMTVEIDCSCKNLQVRLKMNYLWFENE